MAHTSPALVANLSDTRTHPYSHLLAVASREQVKTDCAAAERQDAHDVLRARERILQCVHAQAWADARDLFATTGDLRDLESAGNADVLRFVPDMPLSADVARKLHKVDGADGPPRTMAATISQILTSEQCDTYPWLAEGRRATDLEREVAVAGLAARLKRQRAETALRTEPAHRQEGALRVMAQAAGLRAHPLTKLTRVEDLPEGTFCPHEVGVVIEGAASVSKVDHAARLHNGALLLVEAKYIGSKTNGHKRLLREMNAKATEWRDAFGAEAVIVAAFIGGAVSERNVLDLQRKSIAVVWEHDTDAYVRWLREAGRARPAAA